MNEYLQGVRILPWFNPKYRDKALIAAAKAENHLETMKLHAYSPEIFSIEKRRLNAQIAQVTKLWNADMDEWLSDRVGKVMSQLEAEQISV